MTQRENQAIYSSLLKNDGETMLAMNKQTIYGILNDADGFSISDGTATTFWKEIFALLKGQEESEQEFLLGSIMSFVNKDGLNQIIYGQDKFIAILLILKAVREKLRFFEHHDTKLQDICSTIDRLIHGLKCGHIDEKSSRIVMQNQESDLLNILLTGKVANDSRSRNAEAYRFFQKKINGLSVAQCCSLPDIILYSCFLLHIEADTEEEGKGAFKLIKEMK